MKSTIHCSDNQQLHENILEMNLHLYIFISSRLYHSLISINTLSNKQYYKITAHIKKTNRNEEGTVVRRSGSVFARIYTMFASFFYSPFYKRVEKQHSACVYVCVCAFTAVLSRLQQQRANTLHILDVTKCKIESRSNFNSKKRQEHFLS